MTCSTCGCCNCTSTAEPTPESVKEAVRACLAELGVGTDTGSGATGVTEARVTEIIQQQGYLSRTEIDQIIASKQCVTESQLSARGYVTATSLDGKGYTTLDAVRGLGYVTSQELASRSYVTEDALASRNYMSADAVTARGYITDAQVQLKGYLTEDQLLRRGYVTEMDLNAKGYVTEVGLNAKGFATEPRAKTIAAECIAATGGNGGGDITIVGVDEARVNEILEEKGCLTTQALEAKDYVTGTQLATFGYTTEAAVLALGYTTDAQVEAKGYVTQVDLSGRGYINDAHVEAKGYVTASVVMGYGYITSPEVAALGYITDAEVSAKGFVTDDQVVSKGYITGDAVTARGYATTEQLNAKECVTPTQLESSGFVTNDVLVSYGFVTGQALEQRAYVTLADVQQLSYVTTTELESMGFLTKSDLPTTPVATAASTVWVYERRVDAVLADLEGLRFYALDTNQYYTVKDGAAVLSAADGVTHFIGNIDERAFAIAYEAVGNAYKDNYVSLFTHEDVEHKQCVKITAGETKLRIVTSDGSPYYASVSGDEPIQLDSGATLVYEHASDYYGCMTIVHDKAADITEFTVSANISPYLGSCQVSDTDTLRSVAPKIVTPVPRITVHRELELPPSEVPRPGVTLAQLSDYLGTVDWADTPTAMSVKLDEFRIPYLNVAHIPSSKGSERVQFGGDLPSHKRYQVDQLFRLSENWDFGVSEKSGKLGFGIYGGGRSDNGWVVSGGSNHRTGWSVRPAWVGTQMALYSYHANRPTIGSPDGSAWGQHFRGPVLEPGRLYAHRFVITLNDPGQANGSIEAWLDDIKYVDEHNILFMDGTPVMDKFFCCSFHGGGSSSFSPQRIVNAEYRSVVYSSLDIE